MEGSCVTEFLDLHGRTNKVLRDVVDSALRQHGLHLGQDHLLAALWERDGRTPGDIAAAGGVSTPAVTRTADRLVTAGLITRRPDDADGRLVRLWLTAAGRRLQDAVERERRLIDEQVTAGLTATERKHLLAALRKVRQAALDLQARNE